jgi:hypothetical protein
VPEAPAHRALPGRIEISLPALGELYNALDPSPLVSRDLDDRVDEYIVDTAADEPSDAELELVITCAASRDDGVKASDVEAAVQTYYAYLADWQRKRVHRLLREGRLALAFGLAFLAVCTGLGQLARALVPEPIGEFLYQGLSIIGWVANWRPIEIFLYDWRPMSRRAKLYDRLSRMRVTVRGP